MKADLDAVTTEKDEALARLAESSAAQQNKLLRDKQLQVCVALCTNAMPTSIVINVLALIVPNPIPGARVDGVLS